ncbi:release factor glutamine methyltransferase [Tsuneonella deserti]|uniref:Release factor glutamine methyltransferase n=1 Tax=Tsuneonella deserti TaxID=2035528 RepID=A0ABQ1S038_9SPHN|nr:peptide chain release factor N(5)-glutamine methyltransferase [Tsuneonella deserti]GGD85977.1 release factor glutamine methyltransferase [Tsuneonella deserti]
MTVAEAIRAASERLAGTSDTARLDVELLMAHALGCSRSEVLLRHMRDPAPAGFEALVARRISHEPVAYITGEQEFYGRRFRVSPAVLIPRGDSETPVIAALEARGEARRVLDCGTGSGALLLTLLAELPAARGVGIDRSAGALAIASQNALNLGLADRADLRVADWTAPGWTDPLGKFDLVIANPPYVEDTAPLDRSVRDHEPHGALFAGPEGLEDYRVLIPRLPDLLEPHGVAVLEIGHRQHEAVSAIAREAGFTAALHRDLAGRPRALVLSRNS